MHPCIKSNIMNLSTSRLHSSMTTVENTLVGLLRAIVNRHGDQWFQQTAGGPRINVVSLSESVDSDGVTRMYGSFAFVVNTDLATDPMREWEKILPLSDAVIPPGFYRP
jgi:hypothetical protein